jgi:hypothetical protein
MKPIVTLQQARDAGLVRYFTGKPCSKGHIDERLKSDRSCCACTREKRRLWAKENPEKKAVKDKKHQAKNLEKFNARTKKWRDANPHIERERVVRRRASKAQRTPSWLNDGQLFELQCVYKYCSSLRFVGLNYHVDHIVPLRGETVSGFHVPWNLQVITAKENLTKSNLEVHHACVS